MLIKEPEVSRKMQEAKGAARVTISNARVSRTGIRPLKHNCQFRDFGRIKRKSLEVASWT